MLGALPAAAATCASLAAVPLPHMHVRIAETVAAGAFTPPGTKTRMAELKAFCRVSGSLKPSGDSDIVFEVWLPAAGWNGRFQGIGNGGFAGSIAWGGLEGALSHGYATAATNTGHYAGGTDAGWALRHPEKTVDFAYRAIHETTVAGKALAKAFYGEAPKRAYFSSCSNGGRQALMEAQRYPEDYDGIVAGAPANNWTRLMSLMAMAIHRMVADPAAYLPAAKLHLIEAAALAACDRRDGVQDGVIENPAACKFDPAALLCRGGDADTCLTGQQVATVKAVYNGLWDGAGKKLFPGFAMGGEAEDGGWAAWLSGTAPGVSTSSAFSGSFFANMVHGSAAWRIRQFDALRDPKLADEKMGPVLNAIDPDLRRFHDRGGKLILYHGWSDAAIPPPNTIDYYRRVQSKLGAKEAASFVRLYMVPGMQHCGGGPSPNFFGQGGPNKLEAARNVNLAIERWVEQGVAPNAIVATLYKGKPGSEAVRTRPLCPFPQVAKWKGKGSTNDAANFACVTR